MPVTSASRTKQTRKSELERYGREENIDSVGKRRKWRNAVWWKLWQGSLSPYFFLSVETWLIGKIRTTAIDGINVNNQLSIVMEKCLQWLTMYFTWETVLAQIWKKFTMIRILNIKTNRSQSTITIFSRYCELNK